MFSLDLRHRIIAALEPDQLLAEVAARFVVAYGPALPPAGAEEGRLASRTSPGHPPLICPDQHAALTVQVLAEPDATLTKRR